MVLPKWLCRFLGWRALSSGRTTPCHCPQGCWTCRSPNSWVLARGPRAARRTVVERHRPRGSSTMTLLCSWPALDCTACKASQGVVEKRRIFSFWKAKSAFTKMNKSYYLFLFSHDWLKISMCSSNYRQSNLLKGYAILGKLSKSILSNQGVHLVLYFTL